ncbi:MHYT domain-containing protein [Rhodococcus qingshengii]|uniref:MHYT domain-containing protein n=1 Tax=Rhodococcus qingshengii TaxID=334542 RepID=UPI00301A5BA8
MNNEMNYFSMGVWIVGLAYVLAVAAVTMGFACARRARSAPSRVYRILWLSIAALCIGGIGIWLSYHIILLGSSIPGSAFRYEPIWVLISFLLPVILVFSALTLFADKINYGRIVSASIIMGAAIAGSDHLGMRSLRFQGAFHYNFTFVAISGIAAVIICFVALFLSWKSTITAVRFASGLLMGAAMVGATFVTLLSSHVSIDLSARLPDGVEAFSFLYPAFVLSLIALGVPISALLSASEDEHSQAVKVSRSYRDAQNHSQEDWSGDHQKIKLTP